MSRPLRIGFIGAGRVARALAVALARAGEAVVAVASRSPASAKACASAVAGCEVMQDAQQLADAVDLVFLAVPDDAIAPLASSLRWRPGVMVVHCSGATELSVLEPARAAGAHVGSFHPLLMFAEMETAIRALARSTIALEGEEPMLGILAELCRKLGSQTLFVPEGARAAYHAASHYAAAFLCVLLDQGMKILDASGMGGEAPQKALLSLARGTIDAIEQSGAAQAMAGVYARGDAGTAERHLQALDGIDAELARLYRELASRSIALAEAARRIDAATAEKLRQLL